MSNLSHGHARRGKFSKTYSAWSSMWARCLYPTTDSYRSHGAKGVSVCKRWERFENFLADMGESPVGFSLDRIDNSKGYSKSNCRWANTVQQVRNRTITKKVVFRGESRVLAELVEECGIRDYRQTWYCLKRGWTLERALFEPKRKRPEND